MVDRAIVLDLGPDFVYPPRVAVWNADESGLDWQLVQNGTSSAFHGPAVLATAIEWLTAHEYRVVRMDAARWVNRESLHADFAESLDFPSYYGRNLDALNDCLRDVAEIAYGWSVDDPGLVLVLEHFDVFQHADPESAHDLLDIIDGAGRLAALFGNRLLCLVQSDDPRIAFQPVGSRNISWNPAEWLDSRRLDEA